MMTGCYVLHLYCEFSGEEGCPYRFRSGESGMAVFGTSRETGAQARADARRAGWVLDMSRQEACCPACAIRKGLRRSRPEPRPKPQTETLDDVRRRSRREARIE